MSEAEDDATTSLVTSVYHDVWDEFNAWDHDFSVAAILSLQRDLNSDAATDSESGQPEASNIRTPHSFMINWITSPDALQWEYPKKIVRRKGSTHMIDFQIVRLQAPKMDPHPPYESCAPTSTSGFVGDDPDSMPFVPFPGESFDFDGYRKYYDDFAWQKQRLDPDIETIVLESIRRLDTYHDVPLEDIKRILLPDMRLSKLGERDLLQWLPFRMTHDEIPKLPSLPTRSDMKTRFEGIVNNFCPNLNCIEAFCTLHETNPTMGPPNYVSLDEKPQTALEPCGPECFLSVEGPSAEDDGEEEADETIQNTMTTVLSVCPDLTTCQLAVACCRTCRETHAIRQKLVLPPNEGPCVQNGSGLEAVSTDTVIEKLDHFTSDYEPFVLIYSLATKEALICYYQVTCRATIRDLVITQRTVLATTTELTAKRVAAAHLDVCEGSPAVNASLGISKSLIRVRVVVPASMPAGNAILKFVYPAKCNGRCFNSQIQRGESKRTTVKQGKYGMGLFADETVYRGELILEYTGELIFESTVDCRDFFYTFRGRNYLYKLSESLTIDAAKLGNESRFINHDKDRVNCDARYSLVNGVQRIGIFATKGIKRGTELHLDYGDRFFQDE